MTTKGRKWLVESHKNFIEILITKLNWRFKESSNLIVEVIRRTFKPIRYVNRVWALAFERFGWESLSLCSVRRYVGEIPERSSHRIRLGSRDEQKRLKLSFHFEGWLSRNRDYWMVGEDFRSLVFSLFSQNWFEKN